MMKLIKFLPLVAILVFFSNCNNQSNATKGDFKTELDTVSYLIGVDIALQMKTSIPDLNEDLIYKGLKQGMDSTFILKDLDRSMLIRSFMMKQAEREQAKKEEERVETFKKENKEHIEKGKAFLEKNKSEKGVSVTDSGLQYKVLKETSGDKPLVSSKVRINYSGALTDGTVFDTTEGKDPLVLEVGRFVKGFSEGLQLMSVGSKYQFVIPSELGYGEQSTAGGKIKPFEVLVFEVELLEILKEEAKK